MGLKIYGSRRAACTARATLAMEELGVEYEMIPVYISTGEHKRPPHTSRNPFGQVPAAEDCDLILFESRAISRYVARKYKGSGTDLLREGNPEEAALVDVWMEVEAQRYNPAIFPILFQTLVLPRFGGVPDLDIVEKNVDELSKVLDVYEARLSKTKYLAGDFVSLADLHHLPYTFHLMGTPYASLFRCRRHVMAWWEDISSRPACKKITDAMAAAAAKKSACKKVTDAMPAPSKAAVKSD